MVVVASSEDVDADEGCDHHMRRVCTGSLGSGGRAQLVVHPWVARLGTRLVTYELGRAEPDKGDVLASKRQKHR